MINNCRLNPIEIMELFGLPKDMVHVNEKVDALQITKTASSFTIDTMIVVQGVTGFKFIRFELTRSGWIRV